MNIVTWLHPAPWSPLPTADKRRAYVPADRTDIRRTFAEHSTLDLLDDYELTDRLGYLEQAGRLK